MAHVLRRPWVFALFIGLVAAGVAGLVSAHNGDPAAIHACVNQASSPRGQVIIYSAPGLTGAEPATSTCGTRGTPVDWGQTGGVGATGPAGATGASGLSGPSGATGPQGTGAVFTQTATQLVVANSPSPSTFVSALSTSGASSHLLLLGQADVPVQAPCTVTVSYLVDFVVMATQQASIGGSGDTATLAIPIHHITSVGPGSHTLAVFFTPTCSNAGTANVRVSAIELD
jgi:hypothetical protein